MNPGAPTQFTVPPPRISSEDLLLKDLIEAGTCAAITEHNTQVNSTLTEIKTTLSEIKQKVVSLPKPLTQGNSACFAAVTDHNELVKAQLTKINTTLLEVKDDIQFMPRPLTAEEIVSACLTSLSGIRDRVLEEVKEERKQMLYDIEVTVNAAVSNALAKHFQSREKETPPMSAHCEQEDALDGDVVVLQDSEEETEFFAPMETGSTKTIGNLHQVKELLARKLTSAASSSSTMGTKTAAPKRTLTLRQAAQKNAIESNSSTDEDDPAPAKKAAPPQKPAKKPAKGGKK